VRHSEHTGTCAVAGAVDRAAAGALTQALGRGLGLGLALGLALGLGLAVGGCGEAHPADKSSEHEFVPCVDGTTRCGSAEVVERCGGGQWHPDLACTDTAQHCVDGFCVGDNAPQVHWVMLQNGLNGYTGCTDTSVAVPEGSGFYEVTPEDEQLYIYHFLWTGS